MSARGILCYGPYPADGFMGSGNFTHFDGVLAMYHDQGLAPFKALAMDEGVNYTAGLPVIRTSPAHGTAYDIAGKGLASEESSVRLFMWLLMCSVIACVIKQHMPTLCENNITKSVMTAIS